MTTVPSHYVPPTLKGKERMKQKRELRKSRRMYRKGKYHTRKKVKGVKSRKTPWEKRVRDAYKIKSKKKLSIKQLSSITGCTKKSLRKIVKKGMGAYYSSGSRPNQTPHSWGYARLYSALAGGPAASVDMKTLQEGCPKRGRTMRLAKKARSNSKRNRVSLKGGHPMFGGYRMKERIIRFEKSPIKGKKYRAHVRDLKTRSERHIDFGASDYQQFKDRTRLGIYTSKNHGTRKRMRNYFNRHSGTPIRSKAIEKERKKSKGYYNAKILSHEYLW